MTRSIAKMGGALSDGTGTKSTAGCKILGRDSVSAIGLSWTEKVSKPVCWGDLLDHALVALVGPDTLIWGASRTNWHSSVYCCARVKKGPDLGLKGVTVASAVPACKANAQLECKELAAQQRMTCVCRERRDARQHCLERYVVRVYLREAHTVDFDCEIHPLNTPPQTAAFTFVLHIHQKTSICEVNTRYGQEA